MARKSPQRPNAEEPETRADEPTTGVDETSADEASAEEVAAEEASAEEADDSTPAADRALWEETKVDPIEIALPSGVGFTLRAYRLSTALAPTDIEGREEDEDPFAARVLDDDEDDEVIILDEDFAALTADEEADEDGDTRRAKRGRRASAEDDDESAEATGDADAAEDDDATAELEAADEESLAEEEEDAAEEVPFFLSHRGRLLLFKSPESLVAFVRSGAPHDLAELDTWAQLAERVEPAHVSAAEGDAYELDLVVENLRGGHDTWDLDLLIRAGEVARDLAYALRLPPVLTALSPGSPLDDLDDALRAAAGGGIGGFVGRRRLRRIGAQQASLGWRTIIGKISAAVDWRD